jgi:hypothetical protein
MLSGCIPPPHTYAGKSPLATKEAVQEEDGPIRVSSHRTTDVGTAPRSISHSDRVVFFAE